MCVVVIGWWRLTKQYVTEFHCSFIVMFLNICKNLICGNLTTYIVNSSFYITVCSLPGCLWKWRQMPVHCYVYYIIIIILIEVMADARSSIPTPLKRISFPDPIADCTNLAVLTSLAQSKIPGSLLLITGNLQSADADNFSFADVPVHRRLSFCITLYCRRAVCVPWTWWNVKL